MKQPVSERQPAPMPMSMSMSTRIARMQRPTASVPRGLAAALSLAVAVALVVLGISGCASGVPAPVPVQRFDAAFHHASTLFAAGHLQKAADGFAQAERIASLYDRRALRVQALLSVGAVAATREDDALALQTYAQAATEAQGEGDSHALGVALAGQADALRRSGNPAAALPTYARALQPNSLRADSAERLQALIGQALVWHTQGQHTAAWDALTQLERQARNSASPVLAAVLANQAAMLRDQGLTDAALAKAQEALALDRAASNPMALAADLELLGSVHAAAKQTALARSHWERALRIVQDTGQSKAAQRLRRLLNE